MVLENTSHSDQVDDGGEGDRASGGRVTRKVPAVSRAISILRLLGRSDVPLGVNKIARELGLVPSTALHILRELIREELVAFDERTKRYEIDMGVLAIARSALRRNSFVNAVQPVLDRLSSEFDITMLAAKITGLDHAIVVAVSPSSLPIRLHADLGSRFPALISGTGRCLAAFGHYRKSDLEKRFAKLKWAAPVSFEEWWAQVEQARHDGYGVDAGTFLTGVTIVAVPVVQNGQVTHSVVAVGLQEQLAEIGIPRLAQEMRDQVAGIDPDLD